MLFVYKCIYFSYFLTKEDESPNSTFGCTRKERHTSMSGETSSENPVATFQVGLFRVRFRASKSISENTQ